MAGWGSASGVGPCLLPCQEGSAQMLMNTAPHPTPGKLSWGPAWCGEPLPGFRHLVLKPTGDAEDWPPPQAKLRALSLCKLPLGKWMVAGLLPSPGEDLTG